MKTNPLIGVIILNYNGYELTKECLNSLRKSTYRPLSILVVDSASTDDSARNLREIVPPDALIELSVNGGYPYGNNIGIQHAFRRGAQYVLITNNDIVVDQNCIKYLYQAISHDQTIGIIGPKVLYYSRPDIVNYAGIEGCIVRAKHRRIGLNETDNGRYEGLVNTLYQDGCALLLSKSCYEKIGGFDEWLWTSGDDLDLCARAILAGFRVCCQQKAKVWHKISATPKRNGIEFSLLLSRLWFFIISQKSNLNKLSVLVIVNLTAAGLGFITRVKIANTLGKADFGLFAYAFAIAAYGGAIIRFGFDRTLVRDLIHFPKRFGQFVASSLLLRGFLFLLVTLALLIWKFFSPAVSDLTWGVVPVVLGQSMLGLEMKAVYDSWGRMSRHAVYNLIQRCLYFSAVWLMIILAPKSLSVFWLGVFTVVAVIFYIILQCSWAFKRIDFGGISKSIFNATFVLAKGNLVIWFSCLWCLSFGVINQIILKFYGGKESLGGYAAAWQIVALAMLFLAQVARIGNPATARITKYGMAKNARVKLLIKYSSVMFLIVFPVCLAAIVWPEFILRSIYKPEYVSAAATLRLMGLYLIVYSFAVVASQYLVSARLEKLYLRNVTIGGFVSVAFSFVLIPGLGGLGAILSLLIAHSLLVLLNWRGVAKQLRKC